MVHALCQTFEKDLHFRLFHCFFLIYSCTLLLTMKKIRLQTTRALVHLLTNLVCARDTITRSTHMSVLPTLHLVQWGGALACKAGLITAPTSLNHIYNYHLSLYKLIFIHGQTTFRPYPTHRTLRINRDGVAVLIDVGQRVSSFLQPKQCLDLAVTREQGKNGTAD